MTDNNENIISRSHSPLIFAMHTVPDTETGARKYNLGDLDEKNAIKAMMHLQQQSGREELPHYMQRIVSISAVSRGESGLPVLSTFGVNKESEAEILTQFLEKLMDSSSQVVSWDNTDSDLPVLRYRCLKNQISAGVLTSGSFVSLKQVLCNNRPEAMTRQHNIMDMLGLNYAPVLSAKDIWKDWRKGKYELIHQSCINRALDSYRIYYRYLLMVGDLSHEQYQQEMECIASVAGL